MNFLMTEWRQFLNEGRAPLQFPKLDKVDSSKDQHVQRIDNERQKKIFIKKVWRELKKYKERNGEWPPSLKAPDEASAKKILRNYITRMAKSGKGGAIFKIPPEIDSEEFTSHAADFTGHGGTDEVSQHESMHMIFQEISREYGEGAYNALLEALVDKMRNEMDDKWAPYYDFISIKYDETTWDFNEELVNNAYSLLSSERVRDQLLTHADHYNYRPRELINSIKSAWKRLVDFAKNLDERELIELMKKYD